MSEMFSPSLPNEYYNANTGRTYYLNPYSGQYITNRTYARRMQRGFERGLSRTAARRNIAAGPEYSESRERAARDLERGNLSPYQRFLGGFQRNYGFEYRQWRSWYNRYIREINHRSWPQATSGRMQRDANGNRQDPRMFPEDLAEVKRLYEQGFRPTSASSPVTWEEWIEINLAGRLAVMIEYQDNGNKDPARERFASRDETWERDEADIGEFYLGIEDINYITGPPLVWWFYH